MSKIDGREVQCTLARSSGGLQGKAKMWQMWWRDHGKCGEGAKLKCCNCGGEHSSAYRGCEASKKAAEDCRMQKIRISQGVSYAEAAKVVSGSIQVTKQNDAKNKDAEKCKRCDKLKEETLLVSKNDFVLFMADIMNCSAQASSRNERIKIIP